LGAARRVLVAVAKSIVAAVWPRHSEITDEQFDAFLDIESERLSI
jgi:hypothetical protein